MASSQHRCVFVGNIPYDASEEQLIEICREVGPVVSFRLVIDRETGKPKGYGFCEYKDEETALSARRNLQGYEINGRQLRVDFAENDKGADRNREQGRGGPGLAANVDHQKQFGSPASHGDSVHHQPIGLHIAITAATVMAAALGNPQAGMPNQLASANDPLTLHLAKMSRSQLNAIMSDLKTMATQNKEQARQLLLAKPELLRAVFQAQIMLGMVTPEVLQLPNLRQPPGHPAQPSTQDAQQGQQQAVQFPGLPPLPQRIAPKVQEGQMPIAPQNSMLHNQFSAPIQPSTRPPGQLPQYTNNHVPRQGTVPGHSGVLTQASVHPSIRPPMQVASSSSLNQQVRPPFQENLAQVPTSSLGHATWTNHPNASMQSSLLPRPQLTDAGFQPGPSISSGIVQKAGTDSDRSAGIPNNTTWAQRNNAFPHMPMGSAEKNSLVRDSLESISRPLKMAKIDDRNSTTFSNKAIKAPNTTGSKPSQAFGGGMVPVNPVPKVEDGQHSDKQVSQPQIPSDEESALLQQVLSLTPEQLNSLPPDQREQVIQLQQALIRDQMQLS